MACEPFNCIKCGQRHDRCTGHVHEDDDGNPIDPRPCIKWPRKGASVCQSHGGNAPQVIAATARRNLEREANRLLSVEGFAPITDPYTALADLAGEVVKLKDVLLEKVEELTDLRSTLVSDKSVVEQIDVVFAAYERSLDRCERILSGMARLDLEDRIAKLHALIDLDTANQIITAMGNALDAAEITGTAREVTMRVFSSELRDGHRSSRPASIAARPRDED